MSIVQAQSVLESLPHDSKQYFLWTPGWTEWKSLSTYLKSEQTYFHVSSVKTVTVSQTELDENTFTQTGTYDSRFTIIGDDPALPREDYGYNFQDFSGDQLDLSAIRKLKPQKLALPGSESRRRGEERRKTTRHEFKIEILIVSGLKTFRTHSLNISLTGALLGKEIPKELLKQPYELVIVNPFESDPGKARLLFKAKIVGDLTDARRVNFTEQNPEMTRRLDSLLKSYQSAQHQKKKTSA